MIITLCGFMGSGKSSVGAELARRLGWHFIDLDNAVEESAGMTITEIFAAGNEQGFRKRESLVLNEILLAYSCKGSNLVLALGGGTPVIPENRKAIREKTFCVYLQASADTLFGRLEHDCGGRPVLTKKASGNPEALYERISCLLDARAGFYEECSRLTINTDSLGIGGTAVEIISSL